MRWMGLFSNVGRKFEEAKQAYISDKQTDYVCVSCRESVEKDYEHCPHCGEETIEPVE
jgi:rRNA maturation endonuclease Nob1